MRVGEANDIDCFTLHPITVQHTSSFLELTPHITTSPQPRITTIPHIMDQQGGTSSRVCNSRDNEQIRWDGGAHSASRHRWRGVSV